jgi:uncharacterized protein YcnI
MSHSMNAARAALALAMLVATPVAADAHATLEVQQAKVGQTYKAVLRVPHGCAGAATLKVRVRIPEGFYAVKPMPKAGWTLETVKGRYAKSYDNFGTAVAEGVVEIVWTGSLPDEHYDEFVFRGTLAKDLEAGRTLYFPAVQECADAAERWIEIPAAGQSEQDLKFPAPSLKLLPAGN